MVKRELIDAYKTIDLKTYIDKTIKAPDLSLLKTELNKHERFLQGINQDIYKTFLLNTEILVSMLEKTNSINIQMQDTEKLINEYESIFMKFKEEEEPFFVDEEKLKQFCTLIENFDESARIFKTNKRYLVYSQEFKQIENGESRDSLLLFTNDLLIIGEKNKENYTLKNAFNYNVLQVEDKDIKLKITVTPFVFIFEGEERAVKKAVKTFKEIRYKNRVEVKNIPESQKDESEFIHYLLETENYDKLRVMKNINIQHVEISKVKGGINNVLLVLKFVKDSDKRDKLFFDYLSLIFDNKISGIDISLKLESIIDALFSNFQESYDKTEYLMQKYEVVFRSGVVFKTRYILLLQNKIENIFKLLKRRIYGKYSDIKRSEHYLNRIRQHLIFDGYDFTFLSDYFKDEKVKNEEKHTGKVKKAIENILNEMIEHDNL